MKILLLIFFTLILLSYCQKHTRVVKTYDNGEKRSEGNYINGKVDGLFTFWYKNGQKSYEENYKDGIKIGKWTGWHENGNISSEKYYNNNKRDGKWNSRYENGYKQVEGIYRDGVPDGLEIYWHKSGQKYREITYKYGKIDGLDIHWYDNGEKKKEGLYRNGILISEKYWTHGCMDNGEYILFYKNGEILLRGNLKNNRFQGEFIEYGYFGTRHVYHKRSVKYYKDGQLHGQFIRYFDNGDVNVQGNYIDGQKEGNYIYYDMDGKIYWEGVYHDDVLIFEKSYISSNGGFRLN